MDVAAKWKVSQFNDSFNYPFFVALIQLIEAGSRWQCLFGQRTVGNCYCHLDCDFFICYTTIIALQFRSCPDPLCFLLCFLFFLRAAFLLLKKPQNKTEQETWLLIIKRKWLLLLSVLTRDCCFLSTLGMAELKNWNDKLFIQTFTKC